MGRFEVDLVVTSVVHTGQDLLKAVMAGACVAMTTSSLLQNGIEHAGKILREVEQWMVDPEYKSISQRKVSMSQKAVAKPSALEQANYMKALLSYDDRLPR